MARGSMGLHGKFLISLLVAAALPFCIGLIFFETVGYRLMVSERGEQHRLESAALAAAVRQATDAEAEKLRAWLGSEPELVQFAEAKTAELEALPLIEAERQIRHVDEIWHSLPAKDPMVMAVLQNDAAAALARYVEVHPQVAEIILTDSMGRLVAATAKPSDSNQADESWWQAGARLQRGKYWKSALQYDESSKVFVVDLILPLHRQEAFVGLLKMSVDVTSLVPHLVMRGIVTDSSWHVVLASGHILSSSDARLQPLTQRIPPEMLGRIKSSQEGWLVGPDHEGRSRIVGYAAMGPEQAPSNAYFVFSSLSDDLAAPLWGSFIGLSVAGFSLLGLCLLAGFYIIQRKVLRPLASIESAVRSLSQLARLRKNFPHEQQQILEQHQKVEDHLRLIQRIRTGDQMETLARDIAIMISRVMHYQSEVDRIEGGRIVGEGGFPDADVREEPEA